MGSTNLPLRPIRRRVDLTYRLMTPPVLRGLNRLMLAHWRLGLGRVLNAFPRLLGRYMVIVTRGRRTGRLRRTSVNYVQMDRTVYCIAGWSPRSSWYANLRADPDVEVWLPGGRWKARADSVTDPDEATAALRGLLAETEMLSRLLAGVDPWAIDDPTVRELTTWWPVVRIELAEPERGPGPRPGDLAWLGYAAAGLVAVLGICRRAQASCRRNAGSAATSATSICAFWRRPE